MLKRIRDIFGKKDAKTLFENFLSLSSLQLLGMLLPLITLPYVIRVLGFSNYGTVVLAFSLVSYFQSLTDFSFKITATRDVAVFRSNQMKLSLIYSKVVIVKSLFLLISLFSIGLITFLYPPFFEERLIFFFSSLLLVGYTLFPDWFFQGIEKMKYITILNVGIKLFFTACIFIFLKEESDYWIYPLLHSLGYIFAGIVGQILLLRSFKLRFFWLRSRMIKQTIFSNLPIFVNQFFPTLYNNTSTFLLGLLTNTINVGVYDSIKRIIDISVHLIMILSRVFFPFLNRKKESFPKYRNMMLAIGVFLFALSLLFHMPIFLYLNIFEENAFWALFFLALSIIGLTLYNIFGINYFIILRQDKLVMRNTIYSSIIGFLFAFPLIYYFGIIGTAINLCLARWMMGGGLLYKYLKL